jgi:3-hydroxy-9,10-secoandrosta-1,3,5(10)-triene-9,17-dione monooxygenase reductase component
VADSPGSSPELPDPEQAQHLGPSSVDPFATPLEDRRPDRRFRGRLVAPVTVWTAGAQDRRAGLTVSSMLVAEGDPAEAIGLLDPLSDLFDLVVERGSFVVHVLDASDQRLAGIFAGAYPVDPFEEVVTADGEFGPVISGVRHTLGCRLTGSEEAGFQILVRGRVELLDLVEDAAPPLVRYRGRFRRLSPEA